jgi:hypothetical protein
LAPSGRNRSAPSEQTFFGSFFQERTKLSCL